MKKLILFSVLVFGATLLQAQSITVHQTCGQNGQMLVFETNGHEFVDLGLPSGTLWATCNVGATTPEGYGNYFAWGETATKTTYNWSTYFDTSDGGGAFTKYNNDGGKTVLDLEDDAAHVNWGGSWRMPTKAECQELIDNCTWTWTTQNGINGYKVTSNKAGYTDKSIFLPASGNLCESDFSNMGALGYYWSSSLFELSSYDAWYLRFYSDYQGPGGNYRGNGQSVRPVLQASSISSSSSANDTIRIYSNGCDDYQTFIGSHGSQLTMTAQSDQWSHFVRWQEGTTDNPRTITTNGNADYTAYFEVYKFSVQVQSNDAARGSAYISKVVREGTIEYNESVGTFDAGSEVFLLASQANYGYHFDKWSDGNTSQQRSFILAQDTTFTATFAKNVYSITANAEHGSISGNSSAEYLDYVTLTVNPDYGYHFTQWSDGLKDNPRTIVLTQDTTFTAEFAVDKSGTCGKNNLLQWTFADDGTLTISGNGELTENYTFGLEAPTQMQQLVVGNEVTAIGERAFYEKNTLQKLIIGSNVTSIGKYAFASINNRQLTSLVMPAELLTIGDYAFSGNTYLESIDFNAKLQSIGAYAFKDCYRVSEMTCMATVTPDLGTDALASINSYASLCVPAECLRKYQVDPNWGRFDLCELGTTSTVTESRTVTVEPTDNTAIFTWPTENNAASYSLQITKDGVVFCTLVFNSNGQLTGIAFVPSRNGASHAPAATMSVAGMSFTVTGLDGASKYAYRLAVTNDASEELVAYSGEFATTGYDGEVNPGGNPVGIEDVFTDEHKASKILHNGQILILRGDKTYTLQGQEVK